jgi:hypothetical protein
LSSPSGRVRASVAPSFGALWIVPRLPTFFWRYPDVCVEILGLLSQRKPRRGRHRRRHPQRSHPRVEPRRPQDWHDAGDRGGVARVHRRARRAVAVFLASEASGWITGEILSVSGGLR